VSRDKIRGLSSHRRTREIIMKHSYMMKEKMMHSKGGKMNKMHEGMESKKKKLAERKMEMKGMGKS